jgi:hypothetical protein
MASLVEILLRAKDQASAEIKKVTGSLNELQQDGGASSEELGLDFDSLVGAITTGAAIAAAAISTFKIALEFSKEGAEIVRLQDTSAMLASSMGFDMDEIVAKVSAASLNTVSDLDIMSSAAKAMMLGVGSSAEELATLMEVAAVRGRLFGKSATEAFDTIVRGIGRLSPQVMDNLGIIVDADVTYAAYAKSIGKAADELTAMEKRQALVNKVVTETAPLLAESGGLIEDAASKWEQMDAAQANFWNKIGSNAAELMVWWPGFWTAVYTAMTPPERMEANVVDVIDALNEAVRAGIIDETTYNAVLGDVNNALMSNGDALAFVAEKTAAVRDANVEASDSFSSQLEAIWATSESYEQFLFLVNAAGIELALMDEASWAAGKAELELAAGADAAAAGLDNLTEAEMAAAVEALVAAGDYEMLGATLGVTAEEAKKIIKAWEDSAAAHAKMIAQLENVTSLEGNYKGIIDLAYKYTDMLEEKETLQIERQKLINQGWSEQSNKVKDIDGKIAGLDASMAGLADRVVLDMFQATIAIGGVTAAELSAYMQMAIDMGLMSEEGAQAAMDAYGNAIATINGYEIDEKTLNVKTDAQQVYDMLILIQQMNLADKNMNLDIFVKYHGTSGDPDPQASGYPANGQAIFAAAGASANLPYYWVGERGPEPFFPSVDGRIVSNTQAMSALRGGAGADSGESIVVNINTPMNFADKAWVERTLAPYIQKGIREAAIRG